MTAVAGPLLDLSAAAERAASAAERAARECEEQGVPFVIEDEAALRAIAKILQTRHSTRTRAGSNTRG